MVSLNISLIGPSGDGLNRHLINNPSKSPHSASSCRAAFQKGDFSIPLCQVCIRVSPPWGDKFWLVVQHLKGIGSLARDCRDSNPGIDTGPFVTALPGPGMSGAPRAGLRGP